ncbi:hypothetical protein D3C78_1405510 [compost metagenome]
MTACMCSVSRRAAACASIRYWRCCGWSVAMGAAPMPVCCARWPKPWRWASTRSIATSVSLGRVRAQHCCRPRIRRCGALPVTAANAWKCSLRSALSRPWQVPSLCPMSRCGQRFVLYWRPCNTPLRHNWTPVVQLSCRGCWPPCKGASSRPALAAPLVVDAWTCCQPGATFIPSMCATCRPPRPGVSDLRRPT